MSLVNYKHVDVCQEELVVLRDINFHVERGEFVYLLGKVGSGKSTLLKSTKSRTLVGEKIVPTAGNAETPLPDATRDAVAAGTTVQVPSDWLDGPSAADLEDAIPANL